MQLNVLVVQATDIPRLGFMTAADPYVVVTVPSAGQSHMTRVVTNTLTPVWNEQFQFTLMDTRNCSLLVQIKNGDTIFDNNDIARIEISLSQIPPGRAIDHWFEMVGCKQGCDNCKIHLNLLLVPIQQFHSLSMGYITSPSFYANAYIQQQQPQIPATVDGILPPCGNVSLTTLLPPAQQPAPPSSGVSFAYNPSLLIPPPVKP